MKVLLVDSSGQVISETLNVVNISLPGRAATPESPNPLNMRILFPQGDIMDAYLVRLGRRAVDVDAPEHGQCKRLLGDFLLYAYLAIGTVLDMRKLSVPGVARIHEEVGEILSGLTLEELAQTAPEKQTLDELLLQVVLPVMELDIPLSQDDYEALKEDVALRLVDRHFGEWKKIPAGTASEGSTNWKRIQKAHRRVKQWLRRQIPDQTVRLGVGYEASETAQDLWHKVNAKILAGVQGDLTEPEIRAFRFFHLSWESHNQDGPLFRGPLSFFPSLMTVFWDLPKEIRGMLYLTRFFDAVPKPERTQMLSEIDLVARKLLRLRAEAAPIIRGEERRKKREVVGWRQDAAEQCPDPVTKTPEDLLMEVEEFRETEGERAPHGGAVSRTLKEKLTAAQLEVLTLHAEGLTVTQIAQKRGTSHQSASELLKRAKERARQALPTRLQ